MDAMTLRRPARPTPARLEWLQEQLAARVPDELLAGATFRPSGLARPRLAVATATRLILFHLRGAGTAMAVGDAYASWPAASLRIAHERRPGTTVLHVEPARGRGFALGLEGTPDAAALVAALQWASA
jgi:hypothetical protein